MLGERRGQIISDNPLNESGVKATNLSVAHAAGVVLAIWDQKPGACSAS